MRSIFIALLTALIGMAVSCSAGSYTDLSPDNSGKFVSDDPSGFDDPDYIFYDGEGGDDIE